MKEIEVMKKRIECLQELNNFLALLVESRKTASRNTHYDQLEKWSKPLYDFIHKQLDSNGFVNGNTEANKDNEIVQLWFKVYDTMSFSFYSPFLQTQVSRHHSSAFERNEAMIKEMEVFIFNKHQAWNL